MFRSRSEGKIRGGPPDAGTTARVLVTYSINLGSPPWRYAIHFPSGLQAGAVSQSGLSSASGDVVSWRSFPPARASTTYTSQLSVRSGSSPRRGPQGVSRPPGGPHRARTSIAPAAGGAGLLLPAARRTT